MARLGFGNNQYRLMVLIQLLILDLQNLGLRTNDDTIGIQIWVPPEFRTNFVTLCRGLQVPLQTSVTATKLILLNLPHAISEMLACNLRTI